MAYTKDKSRSSILYVSFAASAALALFTMAFIIHILDRGGVVRSGFAHNRVIVDSIDRPAVKTPVEGRQMPLPNARTLLYQRSPPETEDVISVAEALGERNTNGYLVGNSSRLTFYSYPTEVNLRVIVIVYNRHKSLLKCLRSLKGALYYGDSVSVDVWIDRNDVTGDVDAATLSAAQAFTFKHGQYHVRVQPSHVGIQGQWTNTWRPRAGTKEVAVILEDDITVSRYFWKWLKLAHQHYDHRPDISGYSLSHPGISHATGTTLDIPRAIRVYAYRLLCTWGFSPHPKHWRHYQDWFYETAERQAGFEPLVPGILPTKWFVGEKRFGRERHLWEMWHIYYTNANSQYTVMLNSLDHGLLAINRHELGLHDGRAGTGPRDPLLFAWDDSFIAFPQTLPKIDYDGKVMV